jgi:hypothetical protein
MILVVLLYPIDEHYIENLPTLNCCRKRVKGW